MTEQELQSLKSGVYNNTTAVAHTKAGVAELERVSNRQRAELQAVIAQVIRLRDRLRLNERS